MCPWHVSSVVAACLCDVCMCPPVQADVCIRELVRALAKVVLLYAPLMGNAQPQQPSASGQGPSPTEPLVMGSTWGPAWRAILDCMVQGITYVGRCTEHN